jgi:acyl dehydratase
MHTYVVTARNFATGSTNKIHDDTVAAQYGFGGGLVPGVGLLAYLVHPAVDAFGPQWRGHGRIAARFVIPVYDGEEVRAQLDGEALRLLGPDGVERSVGSASAAPEAPGVLPPVAGLPEPRPEAATLELSVGQPLGSLAIHYSAENGDRQMASMGIEPPAWAADGAAHPGVIVRLLNDVLVANIELGPWIHTGSDVSFHRLVHDGDGLEVRASVAKTWERNGNRWIELDGAVLCDGEPVLTGRHTAIYHLAEKAGARQAS